MKMRQAEAAIIAAYQRIRAFDYVLNTSLVFVQSAFEEISALPEGAAVIFSFWEGIDRRQLNKLGKLAKECPTFKLLCVIQSGTKHKTVESDVSNYGFPNMKLVWKENGMHAKGSATFSGYIFKKM